MYDQLTNLKTFDILSNLHDFTRTFMSQSLRSTYHGTANLAFFPEMYIRSANSSCSNMNETIIRSRLLNICIDNIQLMFLISMHSNILRLSSKDFCAGRSHVYLQSMMFDDANA